MSEYFARYVRYIYTLYDCLFNQQRLCNKDEQEEIFSISCDGFGEYLKKPGIEISIEELIAANEKGKANIHHQRSIWAGQR